jgi:hypothetical protein
MAVTLNANTSTGFIATSDTSGVLQLQTGGTTALTVDASANVGVGTASPSFVSGYSGVQIYSGLGSTLKLTNSTTGATSTDGFELILGNGNSDAYVWQRESAPLIFGTASTERMRINAGAPILCLSGGSTTATGTGIAFPAVFNASSDVNTLDDYEEGAWTPSSIVGTNLTGVSWSAGNYTKVGRLVTLIGYATCTVTSSNTLTYLSMTGAPFTTGIATSGSAFLNNNVRSGTSQISSASVYTFFSAASEPVAGAEVIQFSITYTV